MGEAAPPARAVEMQPFSHLLAGGTEPNCPIQGKKNQSIFVVAPFSFLQRLTNQLGHIMGDVHLDSLVSSDDTSGNVGAGLQAPKGQRKRGELSGDVINQSYAPNGAMMAAQKPLCRPH